MLHNLSDEVYLQVINKNFYVRIVNLKNRYWFNY